MSRTRHTRKPKVNEAVRKAHPFNDATAAWLRENDEALAELRDLQERQNQRVRETAAAHAKLWLNYCERVNAPEAVIKQAEANFNLAKSRLA
jgi:hypothetical protein